MSDEKKKELKGTDAKVDAKADLKDAKASDSKTEAKSDSKPETKSDSKPEAKSDSKVEAKSEAKPETKSDSKPEAKSEAKPQAEAKPDSKPDLKKEEKSSQSGEEKKADEDKGKKGITLSGCFAFKLGMTSVYDEKGRAIPVSVLKFHPARVSQIKTKEKEGYEAVQLAFMPQKNNRVSKAIVEHLKPAGFKEGARFIKEVRQSIPEGLKVGQEIDISSLNKGDKVKLSSLSKGKGFAGVMKRWNFHGGKASHGAKTHRKGGSIGQNTEPARVFPGVKMPGHYGFEKVSRHNVEVVDVLKEEQVILVKGPVSGARNTLVSLQKMDSL